MCEGEEDEEYEFWDRSDDEYKIGRRSRLRDERKKEQVGKNRQRNAFPVLTAEEEAAGAVSLTSSSEWEAGRFPSLTAEEEGVDVDREVNRPFCFSIRLHFGAHTFIRSQVLRGDLVFLSCKKYVSMLFVRNEQCDRERNRIFCT